MINNADTNFVYLSDKLEKAFPKVHYLLTDALQNAGVEYDYLKGSKDVWCRDFMPIQLDEKRFVQFNYDPSYLKNKKWRVYHTDPDPIVKQLGLDVRHVDLNLDGGNVVSYDNTAVITERVYEENPGRSPNEVDAMLIDSLELDRLCIIPCMSTYDDMTGHADGYVRLINDQLGFIQRLPHACSEIQRRIIIATSELLMGFGYVPNPGAHHEEGLDDPAGDFMDATGCYVNYLEVGKHVFIPVFNREEDDKTLKFMSGLFRDSQAVGIECNDIAKLGGLLNCISWNIKRN